MTSITRNQAGRALLCAAFICLTRGASAQTIDHSGGFTGQSDLQLNGSARATGTGSITLTDSTSGSQAGTFFSKTKVNVSAFSVRFQYQSEPSSTGSYADGLTFTIQNAGTTALGGAGGGLGYQGIASSAAVKIDDFMNAGDPSAESTGFFTGGAAPIGGFDITCCVNLHNHYMNAVVEYDGSTLKIVISDYTAATYGVFVFSNVDIPTAVGGRLAYVGLTAGSGGSIGTQEVFNFNYRSIPPLVATDLGTLNVSCGAPTNVLGNAINDLGQITGQSNACVAAACGNAAAWSEHAFVWDPVAGMQDLHTGSQCGGVYFGRSAGNSINVHGTVAGDTYRTVFDSAGNPQYVQDGFIWNPGTSMSVISDPSFFSSSAPWQPAGTTPTAGSYSFLRALGINDSGETVGWFDNLLSNGTEAHGIFEQTGTSSPTWRATPPPNSRAYGINANGLVVGDSGDGARSLLFDTASNTLVTPSAGTGNQSLLAVNSSGQAVGTFGSNALLWNPSSVNGLTGTFIQLTTGASSSNPASAMGINDAGYIVETVLYDDALVRIPSTFNDGSGITVSLEEMIVHGLVTGPFNVPPNYVALYGARAINNLGQIVAYGSDQHAYLLSPPIQPSFTPTPNSTTTGHAAMTVTLNGSKLMYGATVKFNGNTRSATLVSPTQMTVQLLASDFAIHGNYTITVTDPGANTTPGTAVFAVK